MRRGFFIPPIEIQHCGIVPRPEPQLSDEQDRSASMSNLSNMEKRKLERLLQMGSGYVLDFSNRTFSEFVIDSTGKDIYDIRYDGFGSSKANRLRGLWMNEGNHAVAKLLSDLVDYGIEIGTIKVDDALVTECRRIAGRLAQESPVPELDALTAAASEPDFETVATAVRDAIENDKPEAGLDRLHTFVVKYIRSLCSERGVTDTRHKPLHSLFGEYVANLRKAGAIESEMTNRILRVNISVLEALAPPLPLALASPRASAAVVIAHPRATTDDLLEFGHGPDDASEHDVLARRGVNAGREQLRGGQNCRRAGVHVLKAIEVAAPNATLVGRHAADVIGVLHGKIDISIVECAAHVVGVLLIDAEDDGLREAILLEHELGEVGGNRFGARPQRDHPLEVLRLVFVVGDRPAIAIEFVPAWPPPGGIPFRNDAMHAIGCQEAVVDALPQAVLIDRIAEIPIRVVRLGAKRRRGHAELRGRLEIFKDRPPRAFIARAAAVALIDNDEVEEIRWELFEQPNASLVLGERLVDREIHLAAFHDVAGFEFVSRITEHREDAVLRLVNENVAVGEIEDLRPPVLARSVPASRPQLPANLKGNHRLAGASCHRQQQPAVALQDPLNDAVDRDLLVVTLALADGVVRRRE